MLKFWKIKEMSGLNKNNILKHCDAITKAICMYVD